MIQEAYCSFEISKLLKEKGFNENTDKQFNSDKIVGDYDITDRSRNPEKYLDAPTHQMAMAWLRKVYRIHINPDYIDFLEHGEVWVVKIIDMKTFKEYSLEDTESSFEEAVEAALEYTLENLI